MSKLNHYPSEDHDRLYAKLGLSQGAKILDAGGGGTPFKYADVVVDHDFQSSNKHRDGFDVIIDSAAHAYVQGDIQDLPFKTDSFDFVICRHVLEHVEFPDKACDELMRVAKNGFIETPRKWTEYYAGHPTHKWLIDNDNSTGVITFEPIGYNDSPFLNFALPTLWHSQELQHKFFDFSNISCVQMVWNDKFKYHILDHLSEKMKQNEFLAESHYCFARNLLLWMGWFGNGAFHAGIALNLIPESTKYKKLSAFYSILTGSLTEVFTQQLSWKYVIAGLCLRFLKFSYQGILILHKKLWVMFIRGVF